MQRKRGEDAAEPGENAARTRRSPARTQRSPVKTQCRHGHFSVWSHLNLFLESKNLIVWATTEDLGRNRTKLLLSFAARLAKKAEVRAMFWVGSDERGHVEHLDRRSREHPTTTHDRGRRQSLAFFCESENDKNMVSELGSWVDMVIKVVRNLVRVRTSENSIGICILQSLFAPPIISLTILLDGTIYD
ncbi:hypothetical protein Fmac_006237 [Flemingia macrophylla]|uniref:LYR motif containing domain-containing protein n=1 Tax=Flemingia macrophylla TaxID=520843 RepID=A0ABD1NA21_9FABA